MDAEALYVAMVSNPDRMRGARRMQYRCATDRHCLLLDAVAVADTILLHQKRFKNSAEVNLRRSNAAGRAKNTIDGDRHWKPRTYFIGSSTLAYPDDNPPPQLSVQCDHVGVLPGGGDVTLNARSFRDDWSAGHAEIRVRPDGTQYVVQ